MENVIAKGYAQPQKAYLRFAHAETVIPLATLLVFGNVRVTAVTNPPLRDYSKTNTHSLQTLLRNK